MLLPDKHITVAESLLGLGAFILAKTNRPLSIDDLHESVTKACKTQELPAYHDFDSMMLAILFLYSIDAIQMTESGDLCRCAS